MGYWSDKAMEKEEAWEWAKGVLVEVAALEECENHPGTYFEGYADVEEAYRYVNRKVTSGDIVLKRGQTRKDLTDLIKEVYDDNSALSGCPECEENFGPN